MARPYCRDSLLEQFKSKQPEDFASREFHLSECCGRIRLAFAPVFQRTFSLQINPLLLRRQFPRMHFRQLIRHHIIPEAL
jgi:hypothetical protein